MKGLVNRYGIKAQILLLMLLIVSGMIGIFAFSTYFIKESLYAARDEEIRDDVKMVQTMSRSVAQTGVEMGESIKNTQMHVLSYFEEANKNSKEYFWILDDMGMMLLHPFKELNQKDTLNLKDARGKEIIKDFIKVAKEKGEGRFTYYWPPEDKNAGEKISYVRYLPEWHWFIGRGVQVDDIDLLVRRVQKSLGIASGLVAIIALILAYLLGRNISSPIISLNRTMRKIADGDLSGTVKETACSGEIGSMAETVQLFLEDARHLEVLRQEEKESEGLKSEFLSIVSHELRTPLTSIRGSLGLIVGNAAGDLPEKAKKLVTMAYNNCERLILLINDILDIDKINSGNMRIDFGLKSVNDMLREIVESNKTYAEKFLVRTELRLLPTDVKINVDTGRFHQVITNYFSNAVKFSPGGAKVEVWAEEKYGFIRVSVKDSGLGVPEEFVPRLFRKFSQADSTATRKKGGTGLGLFISKQIVEQMGGRVGFETAKGLGSTFWAEFPVGSCGIDERPRNAKGEAKVNGLDAVSRDALPVILHVEPDDDFGQYFSMLFSNKASVVQRQDFEQADAFVRASPETPIAAVILEPNTKDTGKARDFVHHLQERAIPMVVLSTCEPEADIAGQAYAVLTKARVADATIVQTVLQAVQWDKGKEA